jgi:hypothetical protein
MSRANTKQDRTNAESRGGVEVFKLEEEVREGLLHLGQELFHEGVILGVRDATLAKAEVQGVIEVLLCVCADVNVNREGALRAQSSATTMS